MRHFDEVEWTIVGWQNGRALDDAGAQGKDSNEKATSRIDTIVGVVYVGVLVLFMLVYLT
jgi:hypothetical protein